MALIEVQDLRKSYAGREVVRGVSLRVDTGEIVGILGPNGSGKTTTVECIGGLRRRDGGRITVDGIDPGTPTPRLRLELGIIVAGIGQAGPLITGAIAQLFGLRTGLLVVPLLLVLAALVSRPSPCRANPA